MTIICITPMNDCICLMRTATMTPNAVMLKASSSCSAKTPRISAGVVGHAHEARPAQSTITPWKHATVAPPRHLPITIDAAPHRRDHHLAQEAELAVPHDRRRREHRGEHHRHAEDAGVDEGLEVDAVRAAPRDRLQAGAEDEQEQQRLHQRRDDPHAVAAEADELAPPDDLDRAQLAAEAALRHADADDRRGRRCVAPHRRAPLIIRIITRLACELAVGLGVADRRARVAT